MLLLLNWDSQRHEKPQGSNSQSGTVYFGMVGLVIVLSFGDKSFVCVAALQITRWQIKEN